MPPPSPSLENLPLELHEKIALILVESSFLGPPTDLLNLLLVSKNISRNLSRTGNPGLYAHILSFKFDTHAPARWLGDNYGHAFEGGDGPHTKIIKMGEELVMRFRCLRRLRNNTYPRRARACLREHSFLREDLWKAYLMFMENDEKNVRQLVDYARVDTFASNFVALGGGFHDGTEGNGGWTVDSEENALAAWIFGFTDEERVKSETPAERQNIIQALTDVFIGYFKYPSSHAPITSLRNPHKAARPHLPAASALPLGALPSSTPCTTPEHFGLRRTLACPLLTPAALLCCAARLGDQNQESRQFSELDNAVQKGSERNNEDWKRLTMCHGPGPWGYPYKRDPVFTPGSLDGLWVGKWLGIPINELASIIAPGQAVKTEKTIRMPTIYTVPMQFRVREHHQYDPKAVAIADESSTGGSGVFNAWYPEGTKTKWEEREAKLQVSVPGIAQRFVYQTYYPPKAVQSTLDAELPYVHGGGGPYGGGVWDIILTAEVDQEFGTAWGHKQYYGRVRDWDGLVVLVRLAVGEEGRWIFRGYMHEKEKLVGRWRETGTPVDIPGWEGAWVMTRLEG